MAISTTSSDGRQWSEPGAETVAPGVHRIPLPLPGDGLRAVNVYAIEHARRIALVDAGWNRQDSRDALIAGLAHIGAEMGDIDRVVVTHIHHDHYGQAAALRSASGAVVHLGEGERRSLDLILEMKRNPGAEEAVRLRREGADGLAAEVDRYQTELRGGVSRRGHGLWEPPDDWMVDGERIVLDENSLIAVETPGHTRGHVSLLDEGRRLFFAGDHVLPHITPSIGVEPNASDNRLAEFLLSLSRVRGLPADLVLPAHGPVFTGLAARVDALLEHHDRRLEAVGTALPAEGGTSFGVAQVLSWTRHERRFEDLDLFNRVLAVHETAAHLELLLARGRVSRADETGVRTYRRT